VGRRHGREGIVKYTEAQTIARQRLANVDAPRGMDSRTFVETLTAGLRILRRLP
jgi:succinate-semialdehyde dehydrogenase/glutarate-semialdehyde dehydrogenase